MIYTTKGSDKIMADETQLLNKLKKKERGSLEKAIEIYTPFLAAIIFNMAGTSLSASDIEEIVSDAFISLWKSAAYIDLEKGSIKNYIGATAKNLARRKLQKQQPDYLPIDDMEIPMPDNTEKEVFENNASEFVWRQVMALGEPDNEIFVRYYKYGEKIRMIAGTMELNVSTIKTKLARGKKKLKKLLSDAEGLL